MRTVRFRERVPPYQPGEVAGFEDEVAERLVGDGLAEWYTLATEVPGDNPAPAPEPEPSKRRHRR